MATKITVALEDDLYGGPAEETVRFTVGGAEYEIDLNKKNAAASVSSSHRSSSTPAGPGGGRAAGQGVQQRPASAAPLSGCGQRSRESRPAPAGAFRRMSWSTTEPLRAGLTPFWIAVNAKPASASHLALALSTFRASAGAVQHYSLGT
jgi:Lsr2